MAKPTSNRREFLRGQAASDILAERAKAAASAEPPAAATGAQPYVVQIKRRAMACDFEVYLNAGQYPDGPDAALAALDLVEELEAQLSVFRDTSEVSQINRTAAGEAVPVEPRLFELLTLGQSLYHETAGAFDMTAGPLTKTWGFYRRAGAVPSADALAEARSRVGGDGLVLDSSGQTVRFTRPGMELNLGSIGKGYALDRCHELMAAAGVNDFLWHGGQSSVLARGMCAANSAGDRGWVVGIRDPVRSDRRLAEVCLVDRALATSGSSVQFFRHQGKRYGHILDPRTGWPAEGMFSATVLAPTAAEADALSTAFYVAGVKPSLDYCRTHPSVAAVLIFPSATGSKVELVTAGLNAESWRLCD